MISYPPKYSIAPTPENRHFSVQFLWVRGSRGTSQTFYLQKKNAKLLEEAYSLQLLSEINI